MAITSEEATITEVSKLFGELDSLLALAQAAEKYGWVQPEMTASNIIDIADGRHPLQELLVPSFIPNDCVMAGGPGEPDDDNPVSSQQEAKGPSFLMLTGPNNSGKSIYMKQVALIVYLAHIGSYVPASRATIGITDRILTRIATRETMMADDSAFCIDLKQAAFTINFATRRSLILVDEFGKGTTWHDGVGLLAGYVAHFFHLGPYRPKMLIGTHFHELYDRGILPPGNGLEYAHLDVRLDNEAEELEDQITYLYKLVPGPGRESLGILCAELMGVDGEIIERAEYLQKLLKAGLSIEQAVIRWRDEDPKEQERFRRREAAYRRFMAMKIPAPDAPREELEKLPEMLRRCLYPEEEVREEGASGGGFEEKGRVIEEVDDGDDDDVDMEEVVDDDDDVDMEEMRMEME